MKLFRRKTKYFWKVVSVPVGGYALEAWANNEKQAREWAAKRVASNKYESVAILRSTLKEDANGVRARWEVVE